MRWFYILGFLFVGLNLYFIYNGNLILNAVPFALLLVYTAFYHLDKLFLFMVIFTPLSINIEEFVGGSIGLFVPTEIILFGILLLVFFRQIFENQFESAFIKHPITAK